MIIKNTRAVNLEQEWNQSQQTDWSSFSKCVWLGIRHAIYHNSENELKCALRKCVTYLSMYISSRITE